MSEQMWGIHNDALGSELVESGFISIGWEELPDLRELGDDRERLKSILLETFPEAKAGAIRVWAGILLRFAFEMGPGDLVISPYKPDGTLNFGRITGPYRYDPSVDIHPHRRDIEWIRVGVPRGIFPQKALYEIGSALTLFKVKNNAHVFWEFLAQHQDERTAEKALEQASVPNDGAAEEWASDEPSAAKLEQYTEDFVLKSLLTELSHEEFEYFMADLLQAMGYQARVTPYSQDGGVDVIAHRDPLGLEPPLIKVQCKHSTGTMSRPDVQRLVGTLDTGELGLFASLGGYSKDAREFELGRQGLRLLTGKNIVQMTLQHYRELPAKWRARIPMRELWVVDRESEGR